MSLQSVQAFEKMGGMVREPPAEIVPQLDGLRRKSLKNTWKAGVKEERERKEPMDVIPSLDGKKPSYLSNTVEVHSHTPPLRPFPSFISPPVVDLIKRVGIMKPKIRCKKNIRTEQGANYGIQHSRLPRIPTRICHRKGGVPAPLADVRL